MKPITDVSVERVNNDQSARFNNLLSSSVYYFTGFITKVTESDELPTSHLQVSNYHTHIYIIYIYIYIYIFFFFIYFFY